MKDRPLPKYCQVCNKEIPYNTKLGRKYYERRKYCSHDCSNFTKINKNLLFSGDTNRWGTIEELRHIRLYLQPHRLYPKDKDVPEPVVLLRGYIEGSKLRKDWEGIDKEQCVELAEELLEKCEGL